MGPPPTAVPLALPPAVRALTLALLLAVLAAIAGPGAPASAVPDAAVATRATLTGPASASYGATITLRGTLRTTAGAAVPGATVWVQRSFRGRQDWGNLASRSTAADGSFALSLVQSAAYDYRARYAGSAGYGPATSAAVYPAVLRKVVFDSIRTTSHTAGTLTATGRVFPAPPAGFTVYLQRWVPSTRTWRSIGIGRTTGGSEVSVGTKASGSVLTYRLYAPFAAAPPYGAGVSGAARFQHLVWRGVFAKPLLARGGTGNPQFTVIPPSDSPSKSQAELVADRAGVVWGDLNTSGCWSIDAFFGNITDGTVRTSLLRGSTVIGAVTQPQESEAQLTRTLGGAARIRMQVKDTASAHGPNVATDTRVLCNN